MREARGLAYSASAYIMQPNYADTKYGYIAFIATQNDTGKPAESHCGLSLVYI